MFDINDSCPDCGQYDSYTGDFHFSHLGNAKLVFACETNCSNCSFSKEYSTSLR